MNAHSISYPVVCVVGPTASGKSDLAQLIALKLDGEVVSADSMQIYRGMDIGTGKVLPQDQLVPHHGLDLVAPGTPYSAALFQPYARNCFKEIDKLGRRSILAGGTGLYIRAAIDDYVFPSGDNECNPIREKYSHFAEEHGALALWELLHERDPESAAVLHPNNVRRVVRAFELLEEGESYARQKEKLQCIPQAIPAVFIGISVDSDVLRNRIDRRVDRMFEKGLIEEVQTLLEHGFRDALTASQAIGYKEIVSAIDGDCSMEEAAEQIKVASKRYAKRQRTWFRKDKRISWINASDDAEAMLAECVSVIEKAQYETFFAG